MAIKKTADEQKYGLKAGASQSSINAAKVREANRMQSAPSGESKQIKLNGQTITATTLGKNQTMNPSEVAKGKQLVNTAPVVPKFTGTTSYAGQTGYQPTDPNDRDTVMAKGLFGQYKSQFGDQYDDQTLSAMVDSQLTRLNAPQQFVNDTKTLYGDLTRDQEEEIRKQERALAREEQRLASSTDRAVRNYGEQIDPMFQSQRARAQEEAGQRTSIQERLLGAQGGLTSAYGAQQIGEIEKDLTTVVSGINAAKEAQMELYRARREGADAETIGALQNGLQQAKAYSQQLSAESIQRLFEAQQMAIQAGDQAQIDFFESLAASVMQEQSPIDDVQSRRLGVLADALGNIQYDQTGKPIKYDPVELDSEGVKNIGGRQILVTRDPITNEVKTVDLGPSASAGGSGGGGSKREEVIDTATKKAYLREYDPVGGKYIYYNKATGAQIKGKGGKVFNPNVTVKPGTFKDTGEGGSTLDEWIASQTK
jgi:hypothetical protein